MVNKEKSDEPPEKIAEIHDGPWPSILGFDLGLVRHSGEASTGQSRLAIDLLDSLAVVICAYPLSIYPKKNFVLRCEYTGIPRPSATLSLWSITGHPMPERCMHQRAFKDWTIALLDCLEWKGIDAPPVIWLKHENFQLRMYNQAFSGSAGFSELSLEITPDLSSKALAAFARRAG